MINRRSSLSLVERLEKLERKVNEDFITETISNVGKYHFNTYWDELLFGNIGICYIDEAKNIIYSVYRDLQGSKKWNFCKEDDEGNQDTKEFKSFILAVNKFISVTKIKDPRVFFFKGQKFKKLAEIDLEKYPFNV